MQILLIAVGILVVLIALILLYASTRPDNFHVERDVTIDAAPEKIFPLIEDFHRWDAWTPYDKDPAMKKTYSGSTSGKGAHYAWEGNKQVGIGEITIVESTPPHALKFDLHMIKPFEGRNKAAIFLQPVGQATRVIWQLDDKHPLMLKTMSLFINLDRMIGRDFEVGLARLKTAVEAK